MNTSSNLLGEALHVGERTMGLWCTIFKLSGDNHTHNEDGYVYLNLFMNRMADSYPKDIHKQNVYFLAQAYS